MKATRIALGARLSHGQCRSFAVERNGRVVSGFVLGYHGRLYAYVNRCPHWGVDLDLGDGRFYDASDDRIYCKNHGARFEPKTGLCVAGPCRGERLQRLEIAIDHDDALVVLDSPQG